jgi:hypothetical protein
MNSIEKIRAELQKYFDPEKIIEDSRETFFSPDKKFRVETVDYRQTNPELNWSVKRVELFNEITGKMQMTFYLDDDWFYHSWITKDGIDYLLCSENLCGGQTVVDLTNNKISSYASGDDGFIWIDHHLSPDSKKLLALGCFWACPTIIKIYNFENPLDLPLAEIQEIRLINDHETFLGWANNRQIKLRSKEGVERLVTIH